MKKKGLLLQTHPWFPSYDATAIAYAQLEGSKLRPALARCTLATEPAYLGVMPGQRSTMSVITALAE
jgi:hypothetical protein